MIQGIGIDIVELDRVERLLLRQKKFPRRILSTNEWERFNQLSNHKRKVEFLAGRFAAKEAYSKALGTGIGQHLSFQSFEIMPNDMGQPKIYIDDKQHPSVHLSISHSQTYAIAQVIIEK
ncbi:holo-ACP synthase [Tenuibacillus multivorans]|uniref:Holo-[acyl-carrier-protein] synthase n=1 Tax=Tenuibacillus multivorans TaxID=237069 RepID=A0A1H0BA20_9BACI|nr:holo-ACP synthase [Tenuibacillus multivorans]GEL78767.1 holo-[acyl-carrier-protein] synthase [Tenuibacillus multivorans]SDN42495.1 holo-[acyl-carrier protein] synthase [Tenuibacillus multivorans]